MTTFEWLIGLLLGAVALSALARRIKVPYPTFLAIGGMLLAFVPSAPNWMLEPNLALALFVAPVLLDAAFDAECVHGRLAVVPHTFLERSTQLRLVRFAHEIVALMIEGGVEEEAVVLELEMLFGLANPALA